MTNVMAAPDYSPLEPDAYKHQWMLFKALHCAHPVVLDGKSCFIQVVSVRQDGGRISMDVYLAGETASVDSSLLSLQEQPV